MEKLIFGLPQLFIMHGNDLNSHHPPRIITTKFENDLNLQSIFEYLIQKLEFS